MSRERSSEVSRATFDPPVNTSRSLSTYSAPPAVPQNKESAWSLSRSIWARDIPAEISFASKERRSTHEEHHHSSERTSAGSPEQIQFSYPWRRQSHWPSSNRHVDNDAPQTSSLPDIEKQVALQQSKPPNYLMQNLSLGQVSLGCAPLHDNDLGRAGPKNRPTLNDARQHPVSRQLTVADGNPQASCRHGVYDVFGSNQSRGDFPVPRVQEPSSVSGGCPRQLGGLHFQADGRLGNPRTSGTTKGFLGVAPSYVPSPVSPHDRSSHDQHLGWPRPYTPQSNNTSSQSAIFDGLGAYENSTRSSSSHHSGYGRIDDRYPTDACVLQGGPETGLDKLPHHLSYGQGDGYRSFQDNLYLGYGGQPELYDEKRGCFGRHGQVLQEALLDRRSPVEGIFNHGRQDDHAAQYYQTASDSEFPSNDPRLALQMRSALGRPPSRGPYIYGIPYEGAAGGIQWLFHTPTIPNTMSLKVVNPAPTFEIDATHNVRSKLLNDFKMTQQGGHRWELREIYDHIVEFAGDQAGSKFIQTRLETASSEERARVFGEILPNSWQLMNDVFGNYVMQKFFQYGDQSQKKILAGQMRGKVLSLSKQVYGCRVLQKALKFSLVEQQVTLVSEVEGQILPLVHDMNGNHVIQKVIKHVPCSSITSIIDVCVSHLQQLAVHIYGCRIVQRLLDHYKGPLLPQIIEELLSCAATLVSDQYGNYVMQWIIRKGSAEDRAKITGVVLQNLTNYAKQKFASNVVEKCIEHGTEEQKRQIMRILCRAGSGKDTVNGAQGDGYSNGHGSGQGQLGLLIRDNYGNYVIQKLLDQLEDANDYATFMSYLEPEIANIKRSMPSKQAENVHRKMLRLGRPHEHGQNLGQNQPQQYGPSDTSAPGGHISLPRLITPHASTGARGIPTPPSSSDDEGANVSGSAGWVARDGGGRGSGTELAVGGGVGIRVDIGNGMGLGGL